MEIKIDVAYSTVDFDKIYNYLLEYFFENKIILKKIKSDRENLVMVIDDVPSNLLQKLKKDFPPSNLEESASFSEILDKN